MKNNRIAQILHKLKASQIVTPILLLTLLTGCGLQPEQPETSDPTTFLIETTASTIEPTLTTIAITDNMINPIEATLPENDEKIYVFQSIPEDLPILIDLNGDDVKETIFLSKGDNSNTYQLKINNDILSTESPFPDTLSLADIDKQDAYFDIVLQNQGEWVSDVSFFYYDGQKIIDRGSIRTTNDMIGAISPPDSLGDLVLDGQGGLVGKTRGDILHTWFFESAWQIAANGLIEVVPAYYSMEDYTVTLKIDLPLLNSPESESASLVAKAGESASLVKSDNLAWVQLRTQSGKLGWFHLTKGEGNDFIDRIKIGQVNYFSSDVFEGLSFAG